MLFYPKELCARCPLSAPQFGRRTVSSQLGGRAPPWTLSKVGSHSEGGGTACMSARTLGCKRQKNPTQTIPAPEPGKA